MSASSTMAFFGIRFSVENDDEIEELEERTHSHQRAARKASLDHYWANFGEMEERYYSFIGQRLGLIGLESEAEICFSFGDLEEMCRGTQEKLHSIGFKDEPRMYFQLVPDK